MALINGMKFFSIAVLFLVLTGCNHTDSNARIYLKVKNDKDYTNDEYNFVPLTPAIVGLNIYNPTDLSDFTFYNRNKNLIHCAKIENSYGDGDSYFRASIRKGKIHGFLRLYKKVEKPYYVYSEAYKYLDGKFRKVEDENLELESEYSFYYGKLNGSYREFEYGHLVKIGRYYFGNKIGVEKEFYSTGRLRSIVNYQYGKMVSKKKFHGNGKLNSQDFYDHDERAILSKIYNQTGFLVEEIKDNESGQLTRVYDFETKNYKNYQTDEDGHFIGSYYSLFDEDGEFVYAIDISKLKKGVIMLRYPHLSIQCKISDSGELRSADIEKQVGSFKYIFDDKLTCVRSYEANKLVGIYFPKTKEIRGKIDYHMIDNLPSPFLSGHFQQNIIDLVTDYYENNLEAYELINLGEFDFDFLK